MKILMITPYLPYPLYSGGQIRTFNLLKHLSKKHDITLFSFIRKAEEREYIPTLKKYVSGVEVFMKRPPWSPTSLLLSAGSVYPLVVCMYLKKEIKEKIKKKISAEHFDLIHAETFYVMPDIPENSIPTILVEQTIEYLVYKHYTESIRFSPLKWLMDYDVTKIKYWEDSFWKKSDRVVAMSESDKQEMKKNRPRLHVDLVPNGVDTRFFQVKRKTGSADNKTILFVGNFKWLQNREAVDILIKKIWPLILAKLPGAKLWIVGRFPPAGIINAGIRSVKVSSDIQDIRNAYYNSDVLLAPIYGPGGTRYKILESMACGLPVVTTTTGIEGIDASDERDALINQDPEGMAADTIRLLTTPSLYRKLVVNGRKLVEKNFSWQKIAEELDRIYQEAVSDKKR